MNSNASKISIMVESWSTNIRDMFLEWKSGIKRLTQVSYEVYFGKNVSSEVQLGKYEQLFYVELDYQWSWFLSY